MKTSHTVAAVFTLALFAGAGLSNPAWAQKTPAAQHSSSSSASTEKPEHVQNDAQKNAPDAPELKGEPHSAGSVQEELEVIRERQRNK